MSSNRIATGTRTVIQWMVAILAVAVGVAVVVAPLVGAVALAETSPLLGVAVGVVVLGLYAFIAANWPGVTGGGRRSARQLLSSRSPRARSRPVQALDAACRVSGRWRPINASRRLLWRLRAISGSQRRRMLAAAASAPTAGPLRRLGAAGGP